MTLHLTGSNLKPVRQQLPSTSTPSGPSSTPLPTARPKPHTPFSHFPLSRHLHPAREAMPLAPAATPIQTGIPRCMSTWWIGVVCLDGEGGGGSASPPLLGGDVDSFDLHHCHVLFGTCRKHGPLRVCVPCLSWIMYRVGHSGAGRRLLHT